MPDSPQQPSSQAVELRLEDMARLGGSLSRLPDGDLQLDGVHLLEPPPGGGKVSVKAGMAAELSRAEPGAANGIPVAISRVRGKTLLLRTDADKAALDRIMGQTARSAPEAPPPSGPLTGSSAEHTRILEELHRRSLAQLEEMTRGFLKSVDEYLHEMSQRRRDGDERDPFREAAVALRRNGEELLARNLAVIDGYFHKLCPEEGEDSYWQREVRSIDDLDLVDLDEFEGHLAIDRMRSLGKDLYRRPLEALLIRTAELVDEDPLKVRLPLDPSQISRAFQDAVSREKLPADATTAIYNQFGRQVIRQLGGLYTSLNAFLEEQGIRPGLEEQIRLKGTLLKRDSKVHRPQRSARKTAQEQLGQTLAEVASSLPAAQPGAPPAAGPAAAPARMPPASQNIYQSVVDALNFRRESLGLADGRVIASGTPLAGTWDGSTVPTSEIDETTLADAAAIAQALGAMQRDSQVQLALQQASSLREYLAQHRDSLGALRGTSGLTADSLNQLDLVDNLFGNIKSQLDVSGELKPALSNLQIPLAKLALLDPRFFLDRQHSARAVVDKLSALAGSANFPNRALEDRINEVVEEIVSDYERDDAVFDRALEKIERLAEQQERALARNVERVVRIQEGQEKLQKARRAVAQVINERIRPPAAPRVLLDLVESGWRDLLVLTMVREGPDSQAWHEHLKTLDLLATWLNEQQQGGVSDEVLMQRGLEAETLTEMIGEQITAALPTNIAHEAVLEDIRNILTRNLAVESAAVDGDTGDADDPERMRAKVEDLPRLRRWVRRVEQLQKDSWLSYRDSEGKKRRMQLAWISEARDRYIFVNDRGQKVADLNAIQLARKLSQGAQPPAPADRLTVVDQTMYQTLEHVQKTLSFSRNHDSLTRLINRETFLEQMGRTLRHAQLKNSQHAILYLDIDQFALVNDLYDQVSGDQVLTEFSKLLAQLHGRKFSSARIEGDEFAVLVLDRTLDQAMALAEKIRADIAAGSLEIDGEKVSFTVSVGVVPILEYSPSVEEVLESARLAMCQAKDAGRNCVQHYEEDRALAGRFKNERSQTRQDLEQALATDRFMLRAQPIVQTAVGGEGDSVSSRRYELLLALKAPDGEATSPGEFIESAERYGFMTLVDRWVVREAFSWISELMDDQKEVPNLSINLSGSSVTDDDFMDYLFEQISEFGVGTSLITFEITETGTISNLVKAADFVRAFRNIGCKFSLDDFGTGLASHNYLRELPVDYVKIDGTFVTNIHRNRADYAMARSINDLAHFLGQETIAESVENEDIIGKLQEIGVDYLQGWGVGRPKPLPDVTDDLSNIAR